MVSNSAGPRAGVKILIADDQELVLHGIASVILRAHSDWQIVGMASGRAEALELARSATPNIAVVDLLMQDRSGLEVATSLIGEIPGIRILALTGGANETFLRRLRRLGLRGCIARHEASTQIVAALERILAGEPFLYAGNELDGAGLGRSDMAQARDLLTARELTVMRLLAEGRTNKSAAAELGLSVRTIETHRANILAKLGIESIGDLVRIAIRENLV